VGIICGEKHADVVDVRVVSVAIARIASPLRNTPSTTLM